MACSAFLTTPLRLHIPAPTGATQCHTSIKPLGSTAFFGRSRIQTHLYYPCPERQCFSICQKLQMALNDVPHKSLTVLVIGSGGREHALVHSLSKSPYLSKLIAAPGNIGMEPLCERVPSVSADDVDAIVNLAVESSVSLVIVGPEIPLVRGVVDKLREKKIPVFGPTAKAAQLEGSKVFSKCFLQRHYIPTSEFAAFMDVEPSRLFVRELGTPVVIKAGGLAAGKGVIIAQTEKEAFDTIDDMLVHKKFGEAGEELVIEEFLKGEELSFFAIIDGDTALPLASAQDHKAAFDGDKGPNTGGMGAYSPAPLCDAEMQERIMEEVVLPTMQGMKTEGNEFCGVLYCGLMVDKATGNYKVLEFNVRFGDPECQVLCARLKTDLLETLFRAATGRLGDDGFDLEWDNDPALVVVLASEGYPGSYKKGSIIRNIEKANEMEGVTVYHAGTAQSSEGEVIADGGRVLGVTAKAGSLSEAKRKAYEAVRVIDWPQGFYRTDIGWRAMDREGAKVTARP